MLVPKDKEHIDMMIEMLQYFPMSKKPDNGQISKDNNPCAQGKFILSYFVFAKCQI